MFGVKEVVVKKLLLKGLEGLKLERLREVEGLREPEGLRELEEIKQIMTL